MSKVSVIIPVYNKESSIKACIQSVINQTFGDFELIIINDGSNDSSGDIIKEYTKIDTRITYVEQKNKGVSVARNLGIELSSSDYLTFLDADDQYDRTFLERMVEGIRSSNVCYCGFYNVEKGKPIKARMKFFHGDILEKYLYNKCTPNTNCWIIKRGFLFEHKLRFTPNEDWGEDMKFFSKLMLQEKNIQCVNDYLTFYNRNIGNSLSSNNMNKIKKDINWMEQLVGYIFSNEKDMIRRNRLIRAIKTYRLPIAVVYRIYINRFKIDKAQLRAHIKANQSYIFNIRLSNGLRSMKIIYYIFILFLNINLIKWRKI